MTRRCKPVARPYCYSDFDVPYDAELFGHLMGFALSSNSCCVDEDVFHSVADQCFVHRIAGGTRDRRNDGALAPGKSVKQRRLTHVGRPIIATLIRGDLGFSGSSGSA